MIDYNPTRMCYTCLRTGGFHSDTCADFTTQHIVYPVHTPTTVMEAVQIDAEGSPWPDGVPVWASLSLLVGLVLMGVGFVMRDQAAMVVWSWLN